VIVLGRTGRNFAAGMSGGIAYVYDPSGDFKTRCNTAMVSLQPLTDPAETAEVRALVQEHGDITKSTRAWKLLAEWDTAVTRFVKVIPKDYQRAMEAMKRAEAAGLTGEAAATAAFENNVNDAARVGGN
jgi:glutamate synthase (ferredoxin)